VWKPVVGYEGIYEVSPLGAVRSLARVDCRGQRTPEKVLAVGVQTKNGKVTRVHVTLCRDRTRHTKKVHHIVAEAFLGPAPEGQVVRHLDGNAENNAASNLCYGTAQENSNDAVRHGTTLRGEKNPRARLPEGVVLRLRRGSNRGDQAKAAREFMLTPGAVSAAVTARTWKHLSG
jgi:hypothetical protein